ncbi:MAG: YfhO family protein, partial [Candidatus Solibacter sp.]
GVDYSQLHIRRIAFARDALFGPGHFLPAWYPHELLGTPFLANLQSFPWIPTRLILLLFDPLSAFAAGVVIASLLAALFTYLFCRRVGLTHIGAMAAGWTFACAGFFSSRVMVGHLPLLEAYPSLPLLLWLADRAIAPDRARHAALDLALLAAAGAATSVAGHPQLPVYSLTAAVLYSLWRGRGPRRIRALLTLALGLGTTAAVWWPMLQLIRRSTRILDLARPDNDIAMPYARLLSLLWPAIDGWPDIMELHGQKAFDGYPTEAYFWDTCSYVGLIPVAAVLVLAMRSVAKRRPPAMPWAFLALLGGGALVFSLPLTEPLRALIPGTLLRSPARLLYLSTFAAAVAFGYCVSELLRSSARSRHAIVVFGLLFHLLDLGGFSRRFIETVHWPVFGTKAFDGILSRELHGGRVAAEDRLANYDDVGFFDSLMLANPYRAVFGSAGEPADYNNQQLDGSELPIPALQIAGVGFVITPAERSDLELTSKAEGDHLYRVPDPVPRAAFFARDSVAYRPSAQLLDEFLREPRRDRLLLPLEAESHLPATGASADRGVVTYARPSSDEIRLESESGQAGFAHVLESYDPGWSAEVDGKNAAVLLANGFSMAVPVAPGRHAILLRYRTVGRTTGWALSFLSAGLLLILIWTTRPVPHLRPDPTP